ncbi:MULTISPECIES: glycoside hydrolase family 6 protein [Streptomyces]|uniref:Glucanase n=1 Tax=Streptomyces solicathayae TaxID=3081768 RepID=A0ABZ0LXE9_9ACTN|nr:glycoside hydrolase family 6 protein [Streptomyces sp. HUAS YS2]WOX24174.1 glycoside hydrolase family 6 protein [Streptomyces sp. HUAS YS2]
MYGNRTGRMLVLLGVAALLAAGCSASGGDGDEGVDRGAVQGPPAPQQPKKTAPFWVNPDGSAARQVAAYVKAGRQPEAALIRKIAGQPVGEWIGTERPEQEARGFTEAAERADRDALLVLYNIPHRDCGQHSAGGAADGAAYRAWVEAAARGIGERRATVVLEPDAVMHMVDGCTEQPYHEERYALLEAAVQRLKQQPHTTVYLDAGNAGWGRPEQLDEPLRRAGIADADGFAVNVSNFQTTEASTAYGKQLSARTGGKPFVVDTSRNGNGPYTAGDPAQNWCNPPGRALGESPTTRTADKLVRAYLWVKRPGESDGDCRGGPKAGDWFEPYALELARNAE